MTMCATDEKPSDETIAGAVALAIEALAGLYRYATEENHMSDVDAADDASAAIKALAKILPEL